MIRVLFAFLSVSQFVLARAAEPSTPRDAKKVIQLTPALVEARVVEAFPKIRKALLNREVAKDEVMMANGPFDPRIEAKSMGRDGYYDSDENSLSIRKQFAFQGIEVGGGVREGTGLFPSYERGLTAGEGESFVTVKLPLLRGGFIDDFRQKLRRAEMEVGRSEAQLQIQTLMVKEEALKAYWDVIRTYEVKAVFENLQQVVRSRQDWIERKAKAGSLARLLIRENLRDQLDIERELLQVQNQLTVLTENLAFFLFGDERDQWELQFNEKERAQIANIPETYPEIENIGWLARHPVLSDVNLELNQEQVKLDFARNNLLPKVDLYYENVEPRSDQGPVSVIESEQKVGVNLSFPILQRAERGDRRRAEHKIRMVEAEKDLLTRKLLRDYRNLLDTFKRYRTQLDLIKEQVEINRELRQAEETKFREGLSNLINMNIRDRSLLNSQIKLLDAKVNLKKILVELSALTAQGRFVR